MDFEEETKLEIKQRLICEEGWVFYGISNRKVIIVKFKLNFRSKLYSETAQDRIWNILNFCKNYQNPFFTRETGPKNSPGKKSCFRPDPIIRTNRTDFLIELIELDRT